MSGENPDERSPERKAGELLRKRSLTLAVAESCTGGLVAHRITNVPGSSDYFDRGVVSYSNRSKVDLLGVSEEALAANGAVSEEVALEMAEGVRERSETDFGISTTGIAGPGGGTDEKPVGLVYIGLSATASSQVEKLLANGSRKENKYDAATDALEYLIDFVISMGESRF